MSFLSNYLPDVNNDKPTAEEVSWIKNYPTSTGLVTNTINDMNTDLAAQLSQPAHHEGQEDQVPNAATDQPNTATTTTTMMTNTTTTTTTTGPSMGSEQHPQETWGEMFYRWFGWRDEDEKAWEDTPRVQMMASLMNAMHEPTEHDVRPLTEQEQMENVQQNV